MKPLRPEMRLTVLRSLVLKVLVTFSLLLSCGQGSAVAETPEAPLNYVVAQEDANMADVLSSVILSTKVVDEGYLISLFNLDKKNITISKISAHSVGWFHLTSPLSSFMSAEFSMTWGVSSRGEWFDLTLNSDPNICLKVTTLEHKFKNFRVSTKNYGGHDHAAQNRLNYQGVYPYVWTLEIDSNDLGCVDLLILIRGYK